MKISLKKRKIGYTYTSKSGFHTFRKMDIIDFESTLERDLLTILEFNDSVLKVIGQPFTIEYIDYQGKQKKYTPDFLVYFKPLNEKNYKPLLIEVKPRKKIIEKFNELKPKFKIAMSYCIQNDMIFKIYDETRIRTIELENITFLNNFKHHLPDKNNAEIILTHLKNIGHTTIDYLLTHLYVTEQQRGFALSLIWYLIYTKKIGFDIGLKLNNQTTIWLNLDESYEEGILNEY